VCGLSGCYGLIWPREDAGAEAEAVWNSENRKRSRRL